MFLNTHMGIRPCDPLVAFYANAVDIYNQIEQENNKENMGSRKVRILYHLILEPSEFTHLLHWPKCHAVLEQCKQNCCSLTSHAKQHYLQSLSQTRWNPGSITVEAFLYHNPAVLDAPKTLRTSIDLDRNTLSSENSLFTNIGTFEFILTFEVAKVILS